MSLGSSDEVSITTGRRLVGGWLRIQVNTSKPDLLGSLISSRTQAGSEDGGADWRAAMASSPLVATSIWTRTPALRKAMAVSMTSSALSSTCRMLFDMGRGVLGGKLDPKASALAELGLETNLSTHAFSAFADEGEAYARARIFLRAVQALEEAENFFMVLARDANAV